MEELMERLALLKMRPDDWAELDRRVPSARFREMALDYQRREDEQRPRCGRLFKTCRYCAAGGRCGFGGFCEVQNAVSGFAKTRFA